MLTRPPRLSLAIGNRQVNDFSSQYKGVLSFALYIQARVSLIHHISITVVDQLYPIDLNVFKASLASLRGNLDPGKSPNPTLSFPF